MWVTGTYDPDTNQTIWGTGNPVPMFDPTYRPGDNLYTNSAISWDPDTGKMNWYFQFTPGDMWDYDEVGTHILIDGEVAGQPRKLSRIRRATASSTRWTAHNGADRRRQALYGKSTGPRASTRRPASRSTTIPTRTSRPMPASAISTPDEPLKKVCPSHAGGNNYWPSSYSPKTKLLYIPALTACDNVDDRHRRSTTRRRAGTAARYKTDERYESNLTAVDPVTGEIKKNVHLRYPNYAARSRPAADSSSSGCWTAPSRPSTTPRSTNCGRSMSAPASAAPPMTFEVNGKQYVAIASGPSPPAKAQARQHAGTQGAAQRDRALRVRALSGA